ncbi:hypothetical protein J2T14_003168 [Paenibacillus harenae]|nr:hypothetical protein [Paenibacillus harenae]
MHDFPRRWGGTSAISPSGIETWKHQQALPLSLIEDVATPQ